MEGKAELERKLRTRACGSHPQQTTLFPSHTAESPTGPGRGAVPFLSPLISLVWLGQAGDECPAASKESSFEATQPSRSYQVPKLWGGPMSRFSYPFNVTGDAQGMGLALFQEVGGLCAQLHPLLPQRRPLKGDLQPTAGDHPQPLWLSQPSLQWSNCSQRRLTLPIITFALSSWPVRSLGGSPCPPGRKCPVHFAGSYPPTISKVRESQERFTPLDVHVQVLYGWKAVDPPSLPPQIALGHLPSL